MKPPLDPGVDSSAPRPAATVAGPPWRLVTPAAAVEFSWHADRWAHRVILPAAGDGPAVEWVSVEGPLPPDADPRWPASPVLVNVTSVLAAAGPALVGVGLAGRSHFSATVAPDPAASGAIRFEIACRLLEDAGWLGSTYRSGNRVVRVAAGPVSGGLPRTVTWAYSLGPDGPFAAAGATVG